MRITPLEVQNHQFSRRFSGLDADEVAVFLKMVADDYQSVVRENEQLKDSVHQLEKRNDELANGEQILRETLVSAQAMAEKLRETAVAESEVLLSTAEIRAEKILDASHRRAATLSEEIRELRGLRKRYASSIRSTIDTHLCLIDRLEHDDDEPVPQPTGILRKYRAAETEVGTEAKPGTARQSQPAPVTPTTTIKATSKTKPVPAAPAPAPRGP